jgi:hypothetical protein
MSMTGYTKLFSSIIASTIWRETKATKVVWITLLAMVDKYGEVHASVPGLADMARVSVDECRDAVLTLESPDADSRTKDFEGRRIRPIDGGWELINFPKYRDLMSAEERKEYMRRKQAESRARRLELSKNVKECQPMSKEINNAYGGGGNSGVDSGELEEGAGETQLTPDEQIQSWFEERCPTAYTGRKHAMVANVAKKLGWKVAEEMLEDSLRNGASSPADYIQPEFNRRIAKPKLSTSERKTLERQAAIEKVFDDGDSK